MNVLYIDGCGRFGGATRSLGEYVKRLTIEKKVNPIFLCQRGTAADYYSKFSRNVYKVPLLTRVSNSFYHNKYFKFKKILLLVRDFLGLFPTICVVIKICFFTKTKIDLIHANEIHELFTAILLKIYLRVPLIVHVRCKQSINKKSFLSRLYKYFINKYCDYLIFIDQYVESTFYSTSVPNTIIYNSLYINKKNSNLDIKNSNKLIKLGYCNGSLRAKGIIDIIKSCHLLNIRKVPFQLIIAGDFSYENTIIYKIKKLFLTKIFKVDQNVSEEVVFLIKKYNLQSKVIFLGHLQNLEEFYKQINLYLSTCYSDAPGRPIFEAAFFKIPSLTCISESKDDGFIDGKTGISVSVASPPEIADAVEYLFESNSKLLEMGENAYQLAIKYRLPESNLKKISDLYSSLY